jgi:hypothetical protein
MFRLALILFMLTAPAVGAVNGQQPPPQLPGQWQNQLPGVHEWQCTTQNSEITRLTQVIREQNKKISLLGEKVKLLTVGLK